MSRHVPIILTVLLTATTANAAENPTAIPLWPDGPPGSEHAAEAESVRETDTGEHVVTNVHNPSLTPYLPSENATGAAMIVCPGGGHRELWVDHEGHNVAHWLAEQGVAAFVLKYRLARQEESPYSVDEHSLADIQRAIRLVRSKGDEWHVDPTRVGVMGFSAGGEVACLAAMRFDDGDTSAVDPIDRLGCRPDFHALIYPGRSNRLKPIEASPPVFIACGYRDRPDISRGMAELYLRYKAADVSAELHIYSTAGHGFGLREGGQAAAGWESRMLEWMAAQRLYPRQAPPEG